ncbi:MAG: hypothetical protein HYT40_02650 [Candidatus Sungbacteria bacterium]|uniref:Uncharacterized protein n=1 Tax=Candidatus Sungiibacteriota bacterium TaxID=2750080 RepID=A0A931SDK6_9BACT|nr:hypothetical protein [Candidatus Sungbacteria bacterium]
MVTRLILVFFVAVLIVTVLAVSSASASADSLPDELFADWPVVLNESRSVLILNPQMKMPPRSVLIVTAEHRDDPSPAELGVRGQTAIAFLITPAVLPSLVILATRFREVTFFDGMAVYGGEISQLETFVRYGGVLQKVEETSLPVAEVLAPSFDIFELLPRAKAAALRFIDERLNQLLKIPEPSKPSPCIGQECLDA